MRAAGDVRFSMILSCISMWAFRVTLCNLSLPRPRLSDRRSVDRHVSQTGRSGASYSHPALWAGDGSHIKLCKNRGSKIKMELQILDWIQQMRTPVGDVWMVFISRLGNAGMIWILFTCLLLMIPRTRRWGAALAAALCLDAIICNILLKPMVCRIRPCDVNQTIQLLIARPADYSFPSGHTAASFAAVAALYFAGAKNGGKSRCLWRS